MARPTWLAYCFAALMVAVSVYCIGRLAFARHLRRRNQTDVTLAHMFMGFAMVGMLVPRWNVIPNGVWETVFAVLAVYFLTPGIQLTRRWAATSSGERYHYVQHNLIHTVMSCAMLYMYWLGMPITASAHQAMAMSGPPRDAGDPSLTLLLVAILIVSAIWQLDTMSRYSANPQLAMASIGGSAPTDVVAASGFEPETSDSAEPWLAPRLEITSRIVMALTMAYMLVLMT
jgi:hypothetical protein